MLAAIKPNRRRIGAAVLIIVTTLVYGVINSALKDDIKKQMSEAFLGEVYVSKIKELQNVRCEREEIMTKALFQLAEKNSEKMLSVRNRMLTINLGILLLCAYTTACLIIPSRSSSPAT